MNIEAHTKKTVDHFLMLEKLDADYAVWAMKEYLKDPHCPCPNMLALVKEEKQRRFLAAKGAIL